MLQLLQFVNKLKIGYKRRSVYITVRLSSKNLQLLNFFYQKGVIEKYWIKDLVIFVFLRYIKNKPLFTKISTQSTSGSRLYFSYKGLIHYKRNLGGDTLILVNSKYGIITANDAEILKIGGEVLFVFYE